MAGDMFTLAEARVQLGTLRAHIDEFLARRADLADLRADLAAGRPSRHGGLAEAKAWEARLYADLEGFADIGAQVKGFAPLLLDFPGRHDGMAVLWCWLEGDESIDWYHRADSGFAGRRRVQHR